VPCPARAVLSSPILWRQRRHGRDRGGSRRDQRQVCDTTDVHDDASQASASCDAEIQDGDQDAPGSVAEPVRGVAHNARGTFRDCAYPFRALAEPAL
jgi:hypothetical protein